MKPAAIIATNPQIKKAVYERYPATKMERRGCESEKARLTLLRYSLAKRLFAELPKKETV